ncbi:MAG: phosphate regulon transcriptional regulator PhoB [Methylocystaceae bacterium]|jgi:two-component system, OmpR family, phosphate regulon response regulator PhoB|nr:phosphate regulon transcriptional regulator PhoB [Methylocystaceae bacterium]
MNPLVLIVEDEPPLAELVRYNLDKENFRTLCVGDGEEAMLLVEEEEPDLIILDWMLPGLSGIEVCRRLRERKATRSLPIIMLTARGEESDRIRGLDSGADDYIVKPFSPNELVARAKAVLRRASPTLSEDKLTYEDISMDLSEHKVLRDEIPVHLGPTEYRLLRVLMERPGRVFSREQLLDKVWGRDIHVEVRTVDVHIRRLRKALGINAKPDFIRTVRAAGYSLDSTV